MRPRTVENVSPIRAVLDRGCFGGASARSAILSSANYLGSATCDCQKARAATGSKRLKARPQRFRAGATDARRPPEFAAAGMLVPRGGGGRLALSLSAEASLVSCLESLPETGPKAGSSGATSPAGDTPAATNQYLRVRRDPCKRVISAALHGRSANLMQFETNSPKISLSCPRVLGSGQEAAWS
jgi:hypothetical protein